MITLAIILAHLLILCALIIRDPANLRGTAPSMDFTASEVEGNQSC